MKKQNIFEKAISKLYSTATVLFLFIFAPAFDIIYIQKVYLVRLTLIVLKALNPNIIFDFDDAIYIYQNIGHLVKNARCVIVSNRYLKEFALQYNKRVYELISPVRVDNYFSSQKNNFVTLGWIGSPQATKYLYPFFPIFKSLKNEFKNLNIEFMGAERNGYFESLGIKISDWTIEGEQKYLQRLDVGIMPLTEDEWSRCKGSYKLLQYMALGISSVASPVGISKEIIKDGVNGFLASTQGEWLDKLSLLIRDAALRQKLGQEGQRLVKRLYSYEVNADRLIEILENVGSDNLTGGV